MNKLNDYQKHLYDIRWWVLLLFIIGLENIDTPPLDMHTWRQTLTIMISKNFYEIDGNIFFPRTDIGGFTEGIMATEFPIFNYIISLFYRVFGFQEWYGRLLNWTVTNIAVIAFYYIIRKLFDDKTAFFSALVYMISITFVYGRKTMPDTFSLSLVIISVYVAIRFLENHQWRALVMSSILFTIGILGKIPSICFASIILIPLLQNLEENKKQKIILITMWALGCFLMLGWYFAWMPYLLETYKNQLIWPVSLQEGFVIFIERYQEVHYRFHQAFHSYYFFVIFLIGSLLFLIREQLSKKLFFLSYTLLFLVFVFKTGAVFPTHDYYIIPYTPLMALGIGYFFTSVTIIPTNYKTLILLLLMWPAARHNKAKSFREPGTQYLLALKDIVTEHMSEDGKIMVNGGPFDPTLMYFAGRRGWTVNNDVLLKEDWMPDFKEGGLKYILQNRRNMEDSLPYELIYENQDFRIYKP